MSLDETLQLASLIISLLAVGVAIWFSRRGLDLAEQTSTRTLAKAEEQLNLQREQFTDQLNLQREQFADGMQQNWTLTGMDMAVNWRAQVIALHQQGCMRAEIRAILASEGGVNVNADGTLSVEDPDEGNGNIDVLIDALEAAERRPSTAPPR